MNLIKGEINMGHSDILAKFLEMFYSTYAEAVEVWRPNGRNSIWVRLNTKQELVFTYNDKKDWTLSTMYAQRAKRAGA